MVPPCLGVSAASAGNATTAAHKTANAAQILSGARIDALCRIGSPDVWKVTRLGDISSRASAANRKQVRPTEKKAVMYGFEILFTCASFLVGCLIGH